ncbi:hypothetical protein BDN67DRAFT_994978 [Paxillus ammoniavirescens]|nr:hypothetical protein BDN67DRAFT_994978 [Paxillus ammoniavirescens]
MLRSALKHPSRPSSPSPTPTPSSPPLRPGVPPRTTSSSSLATFPSISMPFPTSASRPSTAATSNSLFAFAQGYTPKVSFDTFENPAASMFSFTLHVQSDGYARSRATRVFLCAASPDESGREALEWALECLVQDGDELIVFRGIDQEELDKDHELVREEARDLMRQIQEKCVEYDPERKVSIILELIAGRPTTTLDRLIALYRPDSVVVVSCRAYLGSVGLAVGAACSVYALSHSPVPIIVVRPERKVRKVREKRRRDPKRGTHFDESDLISNRDNGDHG